MSEKRSDKITAKETDLQKQLQDMRDHVSLLTSTLSSIQDQIIKELKDIEK
jgi:TolA-binding protein